MVSGMQCGAGYYSSWGGTGVEGRQPCIPLIPPLTNPLTHSLTPFRFLHRMQRRPPAFLLGINDRMWGGQTDRQTVKIEAGAAVQGRKTRPLLSRWAAIPKKKNLSTAFFQVSVLQLFGELVLPRHRSWNFLELRRTRAHAGEK